MPPAPDPDEDDTTTPSGATPSAPSTPWESSKYTRDLGEHEAAERFLAAVAAASDDPALAGKNNRRVRVLTSVLCHTLLQRSDIATVTMTRLTTFSGVNPSATSKVLREELDGRGHLFYLPSAGRTPSTLTVPDQRPAATPMPPITCSDADLPRARARVRALLASVADRQPCILDGAATWLTLLAVCSWLLATGDTHLALQTSHLGRAVRLVGPPVRQLPTDERNRANERLKKARAQVIRRAKAVLPPNANVTVEGRGQQARLHIRLQPHILDRAHEMMTPQSDASTADTTTQARQDSNPPRHQPPSHDGRGNLSDTPRPGAPPTPAHQPTTDASTLPAEQPDTAPPPEPDPQEHHDTLRLVADQLAALHEQLQQLEANLATAHDDRQQILDELAHEREQSRLLRELLVDPRAPGPPGDTNERHRRLQQERDRALRALALITQPSLRTNQDDSPGDMPTQRRPRPPGPHHTGSPAATPDGATVSTLEDIVAALPPHLHEAAVTALTHLLEADRATGADTPDLSGLGPPPAHDQTLDATARNDTRVWAARRQLLQTAWTPREAADRLGLSPARIADLISTGDLLALQAHGDHRLPAWQFHPDTPDGHLPGIRDVRAAFPGGLLGLSSWMTSPDPALHGRTPRQTLVDGDVDRVVAAADNIGT